MVSLNGTELCIDCNEPTGKAGGSDDSLYYKGRGPYCQGCFKLNEMLDNPDLLLTHIADHLITKPIDQWYSDMLYSMAAGFKSGKYVKAVK